MAIKFATKQAADEYAASLDEPFAVVPSIESRTLRPINEWEYSGPRYKEWCPECGHPMLPRTPRAWQYYQCTDPECGFIGPPFVSVEDVEG